MYDLNPFAEFIAACLGILEFEVIDVTEKETYLYVEMWENDSFLSTGIMKEAQRYWNEQKDTIIGNAYASRPAIRYKVVDEENNTAKAYVQKQLNKVITALEDFGKKYKMTHPDVGAKNPWFLELLGTAKELGVWFNDQTTEKGSPSVKKSKATLSISLETLFESISQYKTVMELLVSKGHIHEHTYVWIDEAKGNKSLLPAILKNLHAKGYYKENMRLTNDQIRIICNQFGLQVSIDTIKRVNVDSFDLQYIPVASTIS